MFGTSCNDFIVKERQDATQHRAAYLLCFWCSYLFIYYLLLPGQQVNTGFVQRPFFYFSRMCSNVALGVLVLLP